LTEQQKAEIGAAVGRIGQVSMCSATKKKCLWDPCFLGRSVNEGVETGNESKTDKREI
jgi:hypothetical protein